jgi:hypothetical protein
MKYHSLPSLSDLKAYQNGKLSNEDRSWIDSVVRNNPLVAEVLEGIDSTDTAAVRRVSAAVSQKISKTYLPSRGFWSKYAGWIGLSSIVLILGSIYFFNLESIEPKYVTEESSLNISRAQKATAVNLVHEENNYDSHKTDEEKESEMMLSNQSQEENKSIPSNEKSVSGLAPKKSYKMTPLPTLKLTEEEEKSKPDLQTADNTRDFENNESVEKVGNILLAVNSVNILSKMNPDDFNTRRSTSGGNDPLGRRDTKRQNNASYSISDLPSFPGGDQALINYFKGQLRPVKVPAKADVFDRSVMIELEVNSRGKLKDYKIYGNLHPTHQKQLEKAIEELPQFDKGKGEKVNYSLAISF